MAPRCHCASSPYLSFLYPSLRLSRLSLNGAASKRHSSTVNDLPESRLNPRPDDYSSPNFADKAIITLYAGRGGNGCISFLREAYMPDGPPNGGDGGYGGNVYIQAAYGETSLHKLARRRFARAGRGKNGMGSAKSGTRGEDITITVPVGTIVREIERQDPIAEEAMSVSVYEGILRQRRKEQNIKQDEERRRAKIDAALREEAKGSDEVLEEDIEDPDAVEDVHRRGGRRAKVDAEELIEEEEDSMEEEDPAADDPQRHKWLLYPGLAQTDARIDGFPKMPKRTRLLQQPPGPIYLDLSQPTREPILLATGGIGGLGNPHFTSREYPRPMFATKGDDSVTMKIELELKLLADVGLVGLPNAGKSTLVRALTNSRARVGNWAFTTLAPNIGTVILDKYSGRPLTARIAGEAAERRTRFTVADIPGLIEGAHLDKGLGIAFLRHVERAGVLAFVIDLGNGNAVTNLKALWKEVSLYAQMRHEEEQDRKTDSQIDWDLTSRGDRGPINLNNMIASSADEDMLPVQQIAGKPWFVVATKADLPETQDNFRELKTYIEEISKGNLPHPSGVEEAWTKNVAAIPVSAINNQGVDRIIHWTVGLLEADEPES